MNSIYHISWPSCCFIILILAILAFVGTRTLWGRSKVREVFHLTNEQWIAILAVMSLLAFVLVHPVSHGIIVIIGGLVYYLISGNPILSEDGLIGNIKGKPSPGKSLNFTCITIDSQDLVADRHRLRRSLFGAPYVNHNSNINIKQNGDAMEVGLTLESDQYTSSLRQYLKEAGFNITINTNNN